MSYNSANNKPIPSNLKNTLIQLEGTLNDWEKISPENQHSVETGPSNTETLEKELQQKARIILDQLKSQIEELSE